MASVLSTDLSPALSFFIHFRSFMNSFELKIQVIDKVLLLKFINKRYNVYLVFTAIFHS